MNVLALHRVRRVVVVMPSWMGDCVMATPALRLMRTAFPGVVVTLATRPGMEALLAGSTLMDRVEVVDWGTWRGLWRGGSALRAFEYSAAVVLPNSFSSALLAYLSRAPMRLGYARDGRSALLTHREAPGLRGAGEAGKGKYAVVSAVDYYVRLARRFVEVVSAGSGSAMLPRLELGVTAEQERSGDAVIEKAGLGEYVVLVPGANNATKRWPAERFALLGAALGKRFGLGVMICGSSGEAALMEEVERGIGAAEGTVKVSCSTRHGVDTGALKRIIGRSRLVVTNDTGPRHIAAALGVATVVLYGPTDPRWTVLPGVEETETALVADPTLGAGELADEHPERCRVDRIGLEEALGAAVRLLEKPRAAAVLTPGLRLTPRDAEPGPRPPTRP